jgi:hypothetical protein
MNLLLHPHTNVNDPVWSVIFMVFLSLCMACYTIYYILGIDEKEIKHGSNDTPEQEELLQLPSD